MATHLHTSQRKLQPYRNFQNSFFWLGKRECGSWNVHLEVMCVTSCHSSVGVRNMTFLACRVGKGVQSYLMPARWRTRVFVNSRKDFHKGKWTLFLVMGKVCQRVKTVPLNHKWQGVHRPDKWFRFSRQLRNGSPLHPQPPSHQALSQG